MLKNCIKMRKNDIIFQFSTLNYTLCIIWSEMLFFGAKIIYISKTKKHYTQRI